MPETPIELDVKIGQYSFKTGFADSAGLLSNDQTLLFEHIPEEVAKGLFEEARTARKFVFPLIATGPKFSLESNIRISVFGYNAQEDRFYLVFDLE